MKSDRISITLSRIILVLIFLIPLVDGEIMGQRYQTMTYTEANGLANSMIFDIVQDSSGVLWIARRSGISSYDGTSFSNYNVADGLNSTSYAFLTIDDKEQLWAMPESGGLFVSHLEGKKWQTISPHGEILALFSPTYTSFDVFYDRGEAAILVGTRDVGFIIYKEKRWRQYTMADGLPSNKINSVKSFEGNIYVASDKGLILFRDGIINPVDDSRCLSGNILAMKREGKLLWIIGETWLGYLSNGKFTQVISGFHFPVLGLGRQCFLHPGRNGKIYFGNLFKVFYYTKATNHIGMLDRLNGLISEGGTSALVDREWNTWITGFRGITKIASERFASYTEKEGLYSNEVASAIEYSPGRYVFGHDGALTFFNGKTMTPFILDPVRMVANYETRVLDIQKDTSGDIWMAVSSLGVARLDKKYNITWYSESQGLTGIAYTVDITPSGTLYAGTTNGLFEFNKDRFRQLDLGTAYNHSIRKIFSGTDGTIYMATLSSGLIVRKGSNISARTSSDNQLANNVYAFLTDSKKRQWVGTAGGLYEVAGRDLKRVNRDGLMINRPVYLILEDNLGNLWVGTDNGVYRWNGRITEHFTVSDGLSGQDINRAAGFIDNDHHIWFGTNNGVTFFRPEFDYKPGQIPPPKVTLSFVSVGNDSLEPRREKDLPYDLGDLVFHARVISLINERQIFVRYYLEGFDTGWSNELPYTGDRFSFNNLRPGSYRFFLKARNVLGTWSDPVISATFTIRPPLWLRWWFLCMMLILFSGIVVITARFILVSRYKNRLMKEVSQRTLELRKSEKELMESNAAKDSFFSIIAHDLRNPFNVILGYLDLLTRDDANYSETEQKLLLLKVKTASARTIGLLENLLTWARAKRGILPFEPEIFNLGEVIADNLGLFDAASQSKNISLITNGLPDIKVFADRNMISTVIRNLISNALKFTFPDGTIIISIKLQNPETILVSVEDNGMGIPSWLMEKLFKIEQRTVIKGTANETGTGLGLILCKEFIGKNGGTIWVSSTHGAGSTFTFTLPSASTMA